MRGLPAVRCAGTKVVDESFMKEPRLLPVSACGAAHREATQPDQFIATLAKLSGPPSDLLASHSSDRGSKGPAPAAASSARMSFVAWSPAPQRVNSSS